MTNLSVNPARSTGPTLFVGGWALQQLWLFWLAPIVGGPVVAEVAPPRDRAALALPANDYFVQQRRPSEFREYQVALEAGAEADLADLPFRSIRYDRLVRSRGSALTHVHGLTLVGGLRGEVLDGQGVTPQLSVGYSADLPWFTPGIRVRGSTVRIAGADGDWPRRHDELGVGLTLQRFVDLRPLSFAFGLWVEGVYHRQAFDARRDAPTRASTGLTFGGLLSAERHVHERLSIRLEGGPVTSLIQRGIIDNGAQTGTELDSPLTWWSAAGVVWRL